MRKLLTLIIMILLLPIVFSSGSIQTISMNPSSVTLCGDYDQYTTITAIDPTNNENLTLTSVTATLYFTGDPGLNFITSQSYNLGNIPALS